MKTLVILASAAFLLAGCGTVGERINDVLDGARGEAAEQSAGALNSYCDVRGANVVARKRFVDAVNTANAAAGKPARMIAQDCNGDGRPDF